jgi:hypothetical protein
MDLIAYWSQSPPPHLLLAAYMGIGQQKPQPKKLDECTDAELEEFLGMMNGG